MQHVHYDLDKVEADIRKLFREVPDDHISDNPQVAAAYRRSVECEIANTRWALNEMMNGTPPEVTLDAFTAIIVNQIMNRLDVFASDPGGPPVLLQFIPKLIDGLQEAYNQRVLEGYKSGYGVDVAPVEGGHA